MNNNQSNNYLDTLNPQQRDAVVYLDGPSLVIAGAGSGKTRVLTYKIVHLLSHGYEPYRIMALTFTNKAAREMKERVAATVGEKLATRLWMGTFHSVFLRILRSHAELLGYKHSFTIYDAGDSKSLIKNIIKDLGLDDKVYKPTTIASIISNAKNALISPEQYSVDKDYREADRRSKRPATAQIYAIYCNRCRLADAMDFDDILYYMNVLLQDYPDIARHYQEFFKFILVDEYQDTNFAQHLIISQLTAQSKAFCVVGDDAQSIYSFRGANITNILNLQSHYSDLKIFKLERNYRSSQNIINAAGSLIEKNKMQIPKRVYSENSIGSPVEIIKTYSDMEESFVVASKISQFKLTQHDSYDDYAVLYRTNAQSRVLEESLRKRIIPYRIYGGLSFYQRKEIKDAICYFRITVNPDDDEALRRVINYPARGIGDTTVKKIQTAAISNQVSAWKVVTNPVKYGLNINKGTQRKLDSFVLLIEDFIKDMNSGSNAYELAQLIYNRTGILASIVHDNTPESISRHENLAELLTGIRDFVETRRESGNESLSIADFLSEVSLATDQDEEENDEPKVTLMTVHASKGLEFKNVFIVGVEDDLFPSLMSKENEAEIEEERRLLYVAITRAKENCVMTYAGSRFRNGQTIASRPSPFIADISPQFVRIQSSGSIGNQPTRFVNPIKNYNSTVNPISNSTSFKNITAKTSSHSDGLKKISETAAVPCSSQKSNLTIGTRISHNRFGEGKVTGISNTSGEILITVVFDNVGEKKLLLKFAKFDIIS